MKIILDLCGGTGSWSKPYKEAGYVVYLVTLPGSDVRTFKPPPDVYGILAAPPCTDFALSGAQYWKEKDRDGRTIESMSIVLACLRIIAYCKPEWWALENPAGRLTKLMGPYQFTFNPCDYGDPYTKRTHLWGRFTIPPKEPIFNDTAVKPEYVYASNGDRYSPVHWRTGGGREKDKEIRSITPPGFAQAFFKANQ